MCFSLDESPLQFGGLIEKLRPFDPVSCSNSL